MNRALARIARLYFEAEVNYEVHISEVNQTYQNEMPRVGETRMFVGQLGRRVEKMFDGKRFVTI